MAWQDNFGFSQGTLLTGGERILFCAGQASVDAEGNPVHAVGPRLVAAGCKPPGTLLGVAALFHPDLMVEIEATAVG